MEKEKKWTIKTAAGCRRLLAVLFGAILLFSFCARLITTDGGKIKVEEIKIDARGGSLNGQLYYPAGTSSDDKYPAVVVTHGGSIEIGAYKHFGQELARRGFVVFCVNAYGNGTSEEPPYEETHQGEGGFNSMNTPLGMWDAVEYVRNLTFVDPTRIGLTGHSMGALRTSAAAVVDCYYYSFNDLMINVLYEQFGQTFTEDEINQDADELAAARLNADQLQYYNALAEQYKELYDTRLRSICLIGMGMCSAMAPQTVEVAGHEVTRACKVNIGFANGQFERDTPKTSQNESFMAGFMTASNPVELNKWYTVDDLALNSTILGGITENASQVADAAENRAVRVFMTSPDTHSHLFLSTKCVENVVRYFQLTLDNTGSSLSVSNQIWWIGTVCTCLSMLTLFAMMFPLVGLLVKTKFFAPIVRPEVAEEDRPKFNKIVFLISSIALICVSAWSIRVGAANYTNFFNIDFLANPKIWAIQSGGNATRIYIAMMTIYAIVALVVYSVINKKATGKTGIAALNIKIGFVNALKSFLVALIFLAAAYNCLLIVRYWFGEDFRFWQNIFTDVRPEYWVLTIPYAVYFFICYLIFGAAVNYTARKDISETKDTLVTVIINGLGVWLPALINIALCWISFNGTFAFNFQLVYSLLLFVPVSIYITRKMYNITNSIWLGASINTVIVCWTLICSTNPVYYLAQNWLGNVLG